jgi:hypothetical protein
MQRGGFRSWTSGKRIFRCAAKSETFTKRHVDRTRKPDPGDMRFSTTTKRACAGTHHSGASSARPSSIPAGLRVGDSGWSTVRVRVGSERVASRHHPEELRTRLSVSSQRSRVVDVTTSSPKVR